MTPLLFVAILVFALAMVHAMVITGWRAAIRDQRPVEGDAWKDDPPRISVIIPARNAAATIQPLLQDLYAQTHPRERTEVIVVDDHSEDGTSDRVNEMMPRWPQLRLIRLEHTEGKKAAITAGVEGATGELMLITDADARCRPDRLALLAAHWRVTAADMILMPVWTEGSGVLGALQEEEQCAFQGATMGSGLTDAPLLANGANMAFTRAAFERSGGYTGDRRSSGDDVYLLLRVMKAGGKVSVLLDAAAAVEVPAEKTWSGFIAQRSRWAGKMRAGAGRSTAMGLFAIALPYALIGITTWSVVHFRAGQGMERTWLLILAAWLLWAWPIVGLVNAVKRSKGTPPRSWRTFAAAALFPLYALPIAIGSMFLRPKWKGRKVR